MLLFGRKPKKILIRLFDFSTGNLVDKTEIEQADLPSWETTPTITIRDEWQILDAQPMQTDEAIKKGHVDLIVRRPLGTGDGAIYASPTIAEAGPQMLAGSSKVGVRRYQILPEDWRQIEFVSNSLQRVIDENLIAIQDVIDNCAGEDGFTRQHARHDLGNPIVTQTGITLEAFLEIFEEGVDEQAGLGLLGRPGLVDGGFAFTTTSLTQYYGCVRGGVIATLCIGALGTHEYDSPEVQELADFAFEHDLSLLDWASATQLKPDTDAFFQLFDTAIMIDESAPV